MSGAAVLTAAYLAPLLHVIDVVGGPGSIELFVAIVVGTVGLAVVLGRGLRGRHAAVLGAALTVAGLTGYVLLTPVEALDAGSPIRDTVSLLTGLSVLRMLEAAVWALGFTPGPLFVSTYLFVRRRYALGVLVGGAALAFFISTGDVGVIHGLVGMLGAIAALGFGRLDREGATTPQRDTVVVLLVAVIVVTTSMSLVPGGEARPLLPDGGGTTIESSLVDGGDSLSVRGSIELSAATRYTVTADRPARWRVGAFDRYTGGGWVRSGRTQPYTEPLDRPEADGTPLRQTYAVESRTNVMPAAWKPTRVEADGPLVTSMGALQPDGRLASGEEYTVVSHEPAPSRAELRTAGTDYPDGLADRYTQLPERTPDRVGTFTAELTADANTTFDRARIIEAWLETNKEYSLEVDRPDGDVAASFIFEMDRGYCTYYATAMVAMLRTQDIPARLVVGYTPGEGVADDRWVVRGLDSHAWVEVYFPGHGWVAFDPTPAGPREAAEQAQLEAADGTPDAVTETETPSAPGTESDPPTTAPSVSDEATDADGGTPTVPSGLLGGGGGDAGGDGAGSDLPDGRTALYGLILLVGAATVAHRSGLVDRGRRLIWLHRPPDGPPARRVTATFDRLTALLGRQYRPRRADETPRGYLHALRGGAGTTPDAPAGAHDRRVAQLFDLYERAHYAGRASAADADRAWALFRGLREEWSDWA